MQSKELVIEPKIQNMSRLFATVGNQQSVAFLTFFIRMNFAFSHLWLKTIKTNRAQIF